MEKGHPTWDNFVVHGLNTPLLLAETLNELSVPCTQGPTCAEECACKPKTSQLTHPTLTIRRYCIISTGIIIIIIIVCDVCEPKVSVDERRFTLDHRLRAQANMCTLLYMITSLYIIQGGDEKVPN